MDINDLTVGQVIEISRIASNLVGGHSESTDAASPMIGRYCLVRCRDAGVHVGTVRAVSGRTALLTDSRRIWRWRGANTLSDVALFGVSNCDYTRIAPEVAELSVHVVAELIPMTDAAIASLAEVAPWTA